MLKFVKIQHNSILTGYNFLWEQYLNNMLRADNMIKLLFGFDQKKGLELVLEILTKKMGRSKDQPNVFPN